MKSVRSLAALFVSLAGTGIAQCAPVLYTFNYYSQATGTRQFGFRVVAPYLVTDTHSYFFNKSDLIAPYLNPDAVGYGRYMDFLSLGQAIYDSFDGSLSDWLTEHDTRGI